MQLIDFSKPLRLSDGRPVRLLCKDFRHVQYPVLVAAEFKAGQEDVYYFNQEGKGPSCSLNLENVPDLDLNLPVKTKQGHPARIVDRNYRGKYLLVIGGNNVVEIASIHTQDGKWLMRDNLADLQNLELSDFDPHKPVQTRDGKKARVVDFNYLPKGQKLLLAIVGEGQFEEHYAYSAVTGRLSADQNEHHLDLINV